MVPVLQIVHEFPRLVNGKIDRQALITGYEKSEVLTLAYTNDELEPLENEADRTRARVILTSIGIFFAHLSKDTSGYKQKCTRFLTLFFWHNNSAVVWRKVLLVLKVILRYGHLKGFFICTRK